jgi:hypothetical protein
MGLLGGLHGICFSGAKLRWCVWCVGDGSFGVDRSGVPTFCRKGGSDFLVGVGRGLTGDDTVGASLWQSISDLRSLATSLSSLTSESASQTSSLQGCDVAFTLHISAFLSNLV